MLKDSKVLAYYISLSTVYCQNALKLTGARKSSLTVDQLIGDTFAVVNAQDNFC
jgi:hypothetical protein